MTDAELEALRRRLYAPDATDAERRRFTAMLAERERERAELAARAEREAALRAEQEAAAREPGAAAEPAPPHGRLRRRRVALAALGLVVAGAVTGGALAAAARPAAPVLPTLTMHPLAVGETARLDLRAYADQGVQNVPSADFADAIHRAGLGAFPPVSTTAVSGGSGSGDGTVRTDPWSAATHAGVLTAVLVLAKDGPAGVTAASIDGRTEHPLAVGSLRSLRSGVPAVGRLAFPVQRLPTVFHVRAAAGTSWILELVYSR